MPLSHALDKETCAVVERFLAQSVEADVTSLYTAIQRSNSSLKRRPKKVLESSIERVLDFLGLDAQQQHEIDSEAELDNKTDDKTAVHADMMNRSLRANLAPQTVPILAAAGGDTLQDSSPRKRRTNGESMPKRQKTASIEPVNDHSLHDLGGMPEVFAQLDDLVLPMLRPALYNQCGLNLPRGVLLHGPPGCGKTTVAKAFASTLRVPMVQIQGPSIVSGMSGESEKGVREKFDEAKRLAPCLLFIDEIDAIAPKRETSQAAMEKRIVAQLLISMDDLEADPNKPVIVLAATNRPDALDSALRRGGRFDTEIMIGVPNEDVRASILAAQTRKLNLANDVDFKSIAKQTAGFVGADLKDLVSKAGAWQLKKLKEAYIQQAAELETTAMSDVSVLDNLIRLVNRLHDTTLPEPSNMDTTITMQAFTEVLPTIVPSSKREGFATIPDVSWADVGALESVKEELDMAVVQPILNPARYIAIGLDAPSGVLLWGPPGCGKTLLAKAVAAKSKANFISIKGPELLDKYLGESEAAVRRVFARARASAPCIIFFDELDALAPQRDTSAESSSRVVNMLLTELDGLDGRGRIFVIGATNRPDMIDNAMLRPGRLETRLYVGVPEPAERIEILRTVLRKRGVSQELAGIAGTEVCAGFTGADLGHLWSKAAQHALRSGADKVVQADLEHAATVIQGYVRKREPYDKIKKRSEAGVFT